MLAWAPFDASATYNYYDDVPGPWYSLYYGGLHGYGYYMDFCDLRFPDPDFAHEFVANEW